MPGEFQGRKWRCGFCLRSYMALEIKSMIEFSSKPSGSAAACYFVCAKWKLCFVPGHFVMVWIWQVLLEAPKYWHHKNLARNCIVWPDHTRIVRWTATGVWINQQVHMAYLMPHCHSGCLLRSRLWTALPKSPSLDWCHRFGFGSKLWYQWPTDFNDHI